jgi:integrase
MTYPPRYKLPKYVQGFVDPDGRVYHYFRRRGSPRIRLPGLLWSPQFMAAYEKALARSQPIQVADKHGSVAEAVTQYIAVPAGAGRSHAIRTMLAEMPAAARAEIFDGLAPATRAGRRQLLTKFARAHGQQPLASVTADDLTDMLRSMPNATAANLLIAIRGLMKWAVAQKRITSDPSVGVKVKRIRTSGHHTWTEDEIAQFEFHHPVGGKARLAFALLLFTGQRRGDVIRTGRQHIRNGVLHLKQQKTGAEVAIPIHPDLREILEATPSEHLTFIVNARGRPWAPSAFSDWFRVQCDAAGLPKRCTAHGLRKAACRRLAEAGCTTHMIAAISGHATLVEIERYTKAADRARLAQRAMATVIKARPRAGHRDKKGARS